MQRVLAAVFVVTLIVGACGGDDDTSSPEPAPDPPETESETESEVDTDTATGTGEGSPDEQAIVESALLELSDFPSGWSELTTEDEEDPQEEEGQREIAECLGEDFDRLYGGDVDADSPTFVSPDDEEISNSAKLKDTEEDAKFVIQTLATDEALACISDQLQGLMEERSSDDMEIGTVAVDRLSLAEFGDESDAYRVTVPITTQGSEIDVYFDIATVRVGRAGTTVTALSTLVPFDTAQLEGYTGIVVDRLTESLADAES